MQNTKTVRLDRKTGKVLLSIFPGKGIVIPIICCFAWMSAGAQQNFWYSDDFSTGIKSWAPTAPESCTLENPQGLLKIQVTSKNTEHVAILKNVFIDPGKDFSLECKIKQNSDGGGKGYGLVWGARDQDNMYCFTVNKDKYITIEKIEKGKRKALLKKKQCSSVDSLGEFNTLTVSRTGNELIFFVNGREVHQSSFVPFMGIKTGFEIAGKAEVTVDRISVVQDNKINTFSNPTTGLKKLNMGSNINSENQEVVPVISHDGKTLYFHVIGDKRNVDIHPDYGDIWYSVKQPDSTWSIRKNMGFPLNNDVPNFIFSVSPDNNTLLVSGHYNEDGSYFGPGISISYKTMESWSIPQAVVIDNYYNDNFFGDFCLSPNRKVLILSIERKDSYGDRDLYVSFLKENEEWTEPKNLGPVVNSFGSEITPFLSADGSTLYYSTNGKPGFGLHDIFVTRRTDDSWVNWSDPQNMGNEINTPEWDGYYTIPASAEFAYLVSEQNSMGKKDIFSIRLSEELKPQPVLLIYGKVLNSKTLEPLEASIAYNNLSTNEELGTASSDPRDGGYKLILPIGNEYSFLATKKDYISQSENVDARGITEYTEIERNLYLTPIEVGQIVRLNNIFFDFDKATLRPESYPELERVVKLLNTSKTVKIELSGHTDNKGSDEYNLELSQRRVNVVRDYLIEKGIDPGRLTAKGYGESKPQTTNDTEEGRQLNRRTEFKILSK